MSTNFKLVTLGSADNPAIIKGHADISFFPLLFVARWFLLALSYPFGSLDLPGVLYLPGAMDRLNQ
jgi:hypothetical protein